MNAPVRKILLNPGPATTTDSVKMAMVVSDICPRERAFGQVIRDVRSGLVRVVAESDAFTSVVFSGSGTTAVEATVSSVVPSNRCLLVLANGAYGDRICKIAEIYGIPTICCQFELGEMPDLGAIKRTLDRQGESISHLAFVHHETSTGLLNPLGELCGLAKDRGIEVIVDAMSSYAAIPIDVEALDIDYLIASSNKCIQGMPGLGFVVCKCKSLKKTQVVKARTLSLNLYRQYRYLEEEGQMQFTPPVQVFYALKQALDEYFEEGGENRYRRYVQNWNVLYVGLQSLGFVFLLLEAHQSRILLSILEPEDENYSFDQMHDYLYERGFTIYPGKVPGHRLFRLSVLGDLTKEDIMRFMTALKAYLIDHYITVLLRK